MPARRPPLLRTGVFDRDCAFYRNWTPISKDPELDFCTSPSPVRARAAGRGIQPRGHGVSHVFTPLGVLSRPDSFGELELTSVHAGVSVDDAVAATGWDLKIADEVSVTPAPSAEEIRLLRDETDRVRLYLR